MKGSSATSAKATASRRSTGPSSDSSPPTRTSAEDFALAGRSDPPDPRFHAYRADLADVGLAGRVIASHYAEPLACSVSVPATLMAEPSDGAAVVAQLREGDPFLMLDDTLGWAWGYARADRLVGYVRSETLRPA